MEILKELLDLWKEMFGSLMGVLPKAMSVALWGLVAIFILPCVFVAGHIYPKWIEWGEDF